MITKETETDSLIGMHLPRTLTELRAEAACHLLQAYPESSMAVLFSGDCDEEGRFVVELAIGDKCPLKVDDKVAANSWSSDQLLHFPLCYKGQVVGELLIEDGETSEQKEKVAEILSHFAVAIINIKLNEEALRATDQYCASLQAFEKGVVLFQESDKEAVGARFLSLMSSVLGTQASALFVLDEVGNAGSKLRLSQALGIPEMMLEELRLEDESWWPETLLKGTLECFARADDDSFPPLAGIVPPALQSIIALPMRYHGVIAGLYMAFNVDLDDSQSHETLESVRRLSELGAALFHRFSLEESAVRERGLQTQLQIASNIQSRLIPSVAPDSKFIDCSWQSRPAQYVGGDYLDLVGSETGEVFSVIADVSGHGINSALLMTSFRSNFRSDCNHLEPCALLEKLNREVAHEVGDTGMFITAAAFKIKKDGRGFTYASAGHNALYLYRAHEDKVVELDSTGPSLGFLACARYESMDYTVEPQDVLLLYTDGIVEATAGEDPTNMYGDDRLKDCLRKNASRSAEEILNAVDEDLRMFTSSDTFEDDVSVSVIKIL